MSMLFVMFNGIVGALLIYDHTQSWVPTAACLVFYIGLLNALDVAVDRVVRKLSK